MVAKTAGRRRLRIALALALAGRYQTAFVPTLRGERDGPGFMSPLVSVIIPAFNAAPTIARAIGSARAQTLTDIEILVIDDGSQDSTAELADAAASIDDRLRVFRQPNAGVAGARATGLAVARGEYVAPLDADDIWHPEKLERQVRAIRNAPLRTGLAYNWYRRIDDHDRVISGSSSPVLEGPVLHRHLEWNFISNGSNILVPTALARAVGYSAPLDGSTRQGAEDYLFQLRIARDHRFVCVPAWLTGYRTSGDGLSTKVEAMLRAHIAMYAQIESECSVSAPTVRPVIARRHAQLRVELARHRLLRGAAGDALFLLLRALGYSPAAAGGHVLTQARLAWEMLLRTQGGSRGLDQRPARVFDDFGPEEPDGVWRPKRRRALIHWLSQLDHAETVHGQD